MRKLFVNILTIITLGFSSLNASAVYSIQPYHIFDLDESGNYVMKSESIYQKGTTIYDYNRKVQSIIVIWGIPSPRANLTVKIGFAEGNYVGRQAIINNDYQIVGYLMAYNHTTVTSGDLKTTYDDFDAGYGLVGPTCYIN